jgi:hypothetical protein
MTPGNGQSPGADKSVGEIVSEVTEKASQLVREEIELAKAEVQQKVSSLAKGIGVALAAGIFLGFAFSIFFHALSWFFADLYGGTDGIWLGYLTSFGILVLLAVIAGLLALRWIKGGSPPTPEMAIEEAKITRAEFEHQGIERDQVERSLEKGDEIGV